MNNVFVQKVQIYIMILALVTASIACKFLGNISKEMGDFIGGDVEDCYSVDRDEYEYEAARLGVATEIPKYPESAVYEVCTIDMETSSIRMHEGYGSEDNELTENVGNDSIPAGTYIGDNGEIPPDWELVEDEFIIEVAEDGTVSGSRIYIIKLETVGTTCTWHRENGHSTRFSGHISGASGYITIENESYTISDSSDCGGSNIHKTYQSVCADAQITISGEHMEITGDGSSDCGFVFTAIKK